MNKSVIFFFVFMVSGFFVHAQKMLIGEVRDTTSRNPIYGVHVVNETQRKITSTSENGFFSIPLKKGDSLRFSFVGYKSIGILITVNEWPDTVTIYMQQDTVLLNQVTVGVLPSEEEFKRLVLAMELKDSSFWYHGMEKPQPAGADPMLNERHIRNPLFIASHPLSAVYYNFSKQEKERRAFAQVQSNQKVEEAAREKFSRTWVAEMTQLEGDSLTQFIAFCGFTPQFLAQATEYAIFEKMQLKLREFSEAN